MENKINDFYKFNQRLISDIIPKQTALIVVDMQKYQVERDHAAFKAMNKVTPGIFDYFAEEVENVVTPNLQKLIDFCHKVEIPVIYTKFSSFMPDGSDLTNGIKFLNNFSKNLVGEVAFPYIGHHSSEIIDELKPEVGDFVIQKNTSGAFMSTRLEIILKNMDIETVLITGVVTNFCVYATAQEAADYGFQSIIVENCCAAWSPEIHKAALKSYGLLTGYVLSYEKVIKKMSKKAGKVKEEIVIH
jgi:nicotinamidase-related amidase